MDDAIQTIVLLGVAAATTSRLEQGQCFVTECEEPLRTFLSDRKLIAAKPVDQLPNLVRTVGFVAVIRPLSDYPLSDYPLSDHPLSDRLFANHLLAAISGDLFSWGRVSWVLFSWGLLALGDSG